MSTITEKIIDRLECYTDYDRAAIDEITRQVMIALDIEDKPGLHTYTESELEDERERAATLAHLTSHRMGYMDALEDVRSLAAEYLDSH